MTLPRLLFFVLLAGVLSTEASQPASNRFFSSSEIPKPTWETQKAARTYLLSIPAPRGQITDRHGKPLAQTRVSYNLGINFPTPLEFNRSEAIRFARSQIALAQSLVDRRIEVSDDVIAQHYENRGLLPLILAEDLTPAEIASVSRGLAAGLTLQPAYLRAYPGNSLAAHIIGYVGRVAPFSLRPVENKDPLFPDAEGREGLEEVFDDQLRGQPGVLNLTLNVEGRRTSERIVQQPVPGYNVITTLDKDIQALCEEVLERQARRGAIVVIDPNTGEILAMASKPSFDPNLFVPVIKQDVFDKLNNDPAVPLYPRAFRSAYPPGSTFKTFVGLAALEDGKITPKSTFNCPATFELGSLVFRNWKKTGAGKLNFVQAMAQSCNTWFYQVGLKLGAPPIIQWTTALGLGRRTGIPLKAESAGNIPTDDYMLRVHNRRILNGDVVNMSIGQGDILITPLQMAQAMGVLAAGGKFHQTRLVQQIQSLDNRVIAAYPDRLRADLQIDPAVMEEMRAALSAVTSSGTGTRAAVGRGIKVAGKTGTAQWGPKKRQRIAAWFAGFAPAEEPRYAFAAVYEGAPGDSRIGGGSHAAPMIGAVLKQLLKDYKPPTKAEVAARKKAEEEAQSAEAAEAAEAAEGADLTVPEGEVDESN